jgi:arginine decarboxylase
MLAGRRLLIFCLRRNQQQSYECGAGMDFLQAFPVAIIDEDYDGQRAAGRGMRQLAAAIEKEGFRVVAGLSYDDASRLVNVTNTEACWLVSVDGVEDAETRWQILEQVLAAKRRRK